MRARDCRHPFENVPKAMYTLLMYALPMVSSGHVPNFACTSCVIRNMKQENAWCAMSNVDETSIDEESTSPSYEKQCDLYIASSLVRMQQNSAGAPGHRQPACAFHLAHGRIIYLCRMAVMRQPLATCTWRKQDHCLPQKASVVHHILQGKAHAKIGRSCLDTQTTDSIVHSSMLVSLQRSVGFRPPHRQRASVVGLSKGLLSVFAGLTG